MSQKFGRTCLTVTAAAVLTGTAAAGPAAARAPEAPYHCVITLHGADVPTARCGAAAETRAARSGTLLTTWYEDVDYGGDSTDIRNAGGPCDAAGFGVSDIGGFLGPGWDDSISSFRTFDSCVVVQGFESSEYGGASHVWVGDQSYVGDDWNDRISSLLTHS